MGFRLIERVCCMQPAATGPATTLSAAPAPAPARARVVRTYAERRVLAIEPLAVPACSAAVSLYLLCKIMRGLTAAVRVVAGPCSSCPCPRSCACPSPCACPRGEN